MGKCAFDVTANIPLENRVRRSQVLWSSVPEVQPAPEVNHGVSVHSTEHMDLWLQVLRLTLRVFER